MKARGVKVTLTSHGLKYLEALLGASLTGALGHKTVNPAIRPLVDAAYNVLAGGTADVTITMAGASSQVAKYHDLEKKSLKSSNAENIGKSKPITVDI